MHVPGRQMEELTMFEFGVRVRLPEATDEDLTEAIRLLQNASEMDSEALQDPFFTVMGWACPRLEAGESEFKLTRLLVRRGLPHDMAEALIAQALGSVHLSRQVRQGEGEPTRLGVTDILNLALALLLVLWGISKLFK